MAADLGAINWGHPAFAPLAAVSAPLTDAITRGADLRDTLSAQPTAQAICTCSGHAVRFVPQGALPAGIAYGANIATTGEVPTRDSLHDFFDAPIWLHWPHARAAPNARQARVITQDGISTTRDTTRDAATLFDENALVFLHTQDTPERCLAGFDWRGLLVESRAMWGATCTVLPFSHAVLEELVAPYKSITAHAWPVRVAALSAERSSLDAALAETLLHTNLASRHFRPLPVMGIPGWCSANEDAGFYLGTTVFWLGRRRFVPEQCQTRVSRSGPDNRCFRRLVQAGGEGSPSSIKQGDG